MFPAIMPQAYEEVVIWLFNKITCDIFVAMLRATIPQKNKVGCTWVVQLNILSNSDVASHNASNRCGYVTMQSNNIQIFLWSCCNSQGLKHMKMYVYGYAIKQYFFVGKLLATLSHI